MDNEKELDYYKGQGKDINRRAMNSLFFKDNPRLFLIHKKAERLTLALYMITDLFNQHEPLKWKLRTNVVSLLSFMLVHAKEESRQKVSNACSGALCLVDEILSPLELAARIRLISPMNFSILREEFFALSELLRQQAGEGGLSTDFTFPEQFFHIPKEVKKEEPHSALAQPQDIILDTDYARKGQKDIKGQNNFQKGQGIKDNNIKDATRSIPKKDEKIIRKEKIKQLLSARGPLTIKDILSTINDCGEKTLQRELVSLIQEGSVKRVGERRWSTYTLRY